MARKAPPKGGRPKRKASAKAAPPKRKSQTRGAAAPPKRKAPAAAPRKRGPSAYEQRIARYLAAHPGATRQQARGHKQAEHITRRQRELARLEAFAEQQAARFRGADAAVLLKSLMAKYRREGIGFLGRIERWIAARNAEYLAQTDRDRKGRRPTLGINLDDMMEAETLEREIFGYH